MGFNTILDFRFWILDCETVAIGGLQKSICYIYHSNWYKTVGLMNAEMVTLVQFLTFQRHDRFQPSRIASRDYSES
jgi:hypothetical protein